MRSWLVMLFWVLVPLQLSWAAADTPLMHDTHHASARHCAHQHAPDPTQNPDAGATHAECSTCHTSCPLACLGGSRLAVADATTLGTTGTSLLPASQHPARPERPQWIARA